MEEVVRLRQKLEDDELWRLARALVCGVYGVSGRGGFFRDATMRDRVRGSAVSLMSAAAELADRVDQSALADIGRRCVRLRSELYVAGDQDYLSDIELRALLAQVEDLARVARSLVRRGDAAVADSA